jgi:GxxExxY protein
MELEHKELTERIIGAAIEVHRRLGPGFLESIYEHALVLELQKRGLATEQQLEVSIEYDGIEVGKHRLDLLVESTIVVELKTVKDLTDIHFCNRQVVPPGYQTETRPTAQFCQDNVGSKTRDRLLTNFPFLASFLPGFLIKE